MSTVLVIAPHPDDEILGCGGTLLRHLEEGDAVHWLIVTTMTESAGYSPAAIAARQQQIQAVQDAVGFTARHELGLPAAYLDTLSLADIVSSIGKVVTDVKPDTLYLPFGGDVHSDHGVVFNAAKGCSKWFRYPSVKKVYSYETPSETDFSLPGEGPMPITRLVDISQQLERKLAVLALYESELGSFPFPRSAQAIRSLAQVRGAAAGCDAAEGFQVLKEII